MIDIPDGTACGHRACLSHKTYPCPFCGRIAGKALTHSEKIVNAMMKHFASDEGGSWTDKEWFEEAIELIIPIVEIAAAAEVRYVYSNIGDAMISTTEESKRCMAAAIADDHRVYIANVEPRPWLCVPARNSYLKEAWECLKAPFIWIGEVLTAMGQVK